ncbi:hypothetical protein NDU88_004175 [Pleurodeles waltl]|uniref:Uncharacterized protein n=1 Tax=Pleurodeles waltl TaxID=8319 RepID=A0AAV7V0J7_PLEWA|nr:hypothetical protein NDU88_004175 [Pleurodeles waltl]
MFTKSPIQLNLKQNHLIHKMVTVVNYMNEKTYGSDVESNVKEEEVADTVIEGREGERRIEADPKELEGGGQTCDADRVRHEAEEEKRHTGPGEQAEDTINAWFHADGEKPPETMLGRLWLVRLV